MNENTDRPATRRHLLIAIVLGALLAAGTITGKLHGLEYPGWCALLLLCGLTSAWFAGSGRIFVAGWQAGFVATISVAVLQVVFLNRYFANNPEYLQVADSLPLTPRLFILLVAPVQGVAFGLVSGAVAWLLTRYLPIRGVTGGD